MQCIGQTTSCTTSCKANPEQVRKKLWICRSLDLLYTTNPIQNEEMDFVLLCSSMHGTRSLDKVELDGDKWSVGYVCSTGSDKA